MSTKKMRIMVVGLIGLLLLATGGYLLADFIIGQKEQAAYEETASLVLFSFDSDTIDKVTIDSEEGHFLIEQGADTWLLTETDYPHDFILNTSYISTVCSYMSELTAEKKFDTKDQDLAAYGLDTPSILTCYAGSTAYTLEIGQPSATQEYFYVKKPDDDTIYGISFEYGALLSGDTSYLKSTYLLSFSETTVSEVTLERDGETAFDFILENGQWQMLAPLPEASINSAQVKSFLTSLVRFELDSFIMIADDSTDLSKFGLDNPRFTLNITQTDGTETTIHFADYSEQDGSVYLIYEDSRQIATLSTSIASFLHTEASELLNEDILPVTMDQVTAVDATADDIAFHMDIDYANAQYSFDGTDITALGDDAISLFKSLFDTMANLSFESLDIDADVNTETEPTVRFCYTLTDGSQTELSLIPIDDITYWAMIDGEYTGMIVRRRSVSGNIGVLTFHEKMMDYLAQHNAD